MKIRDSGHVINKAVYMALVFVNLDGNKEVLGLWKYKRKKKVQSFG